MDLSRLFQRMRELSLALLLSGPAILLADSGNGVLVDEATVYEDQAGNNGGGESDVCIGNVGATTNTRRGFVRYTLPAIPAGSAVDRVLWAMTQFNVRENGAGAPKTATLLVRRVTATWVEGNGSGGGMGGPCGGGENVAGVDWAGQPTVGATDSATQALTNNAGFAFTLDTDVGTDDDGLIADVQAWVDNGATNFGWTVAVSEEGTTDNARRMTAGTLTIHWTPPPVEQLVFADGFESPDP